MKIDREIYKELKYISELDSCQERLKDYLKELKPESYRSIPQNSSLHLGLGLLANRLNEMGLDMRVVLKPTFFIPWTTYAVKEFLFRPIMKAMTGKERTRDLHKTNGEINEVWDVMFRELGEKHHVEYIPFPNKNNERQSN